MKTPSAPRPAVILPLCSTLGTLLQDLPKDREYPDRGAAHHDRLPALSNPSFRTARPLSAYIASTSDTT